ncbi:hypothetical protein VNO77_04203 [Canavalia gladiata]|uniref:Protein ENHANCED DISEASE RESISTANCE 2 C-terminal domain-containing protein n=1 Tax=Canavalia gladiata TaxID=3824 RepID=A0AAN9RCY9_CANGL
MGPCVSRSQGCVEGKMNFSKKTQKKRRHRNGRRVSSQTNGSLDEIDMPDLSITFQGEGLISDMPLPDSDFLISLETSGSASGTAEEAWFDSFAGFDSDCEEDFQSVLDDVISQNGIEANLGVSPDQVRNTGELSKSYCAHISGGFRSSDAQFLDEFSSEKDDEVSDNCGILPNNCLSCLPSTDRRSLCSSPSNTRKKAPTKHSFRCSGNATLCTFKVRGPNYLKDKKKDFASNYSAYYPFGVDVFLSPRKVDHIARFVQLPVFTSCGKLPPILIINVKIPLYPPSFFQGETDGEGMSFVLYFKLSESYSKEVPLNFQENIRFLNCYLLMDDEVENVKGFRGDTTVPFHDRLKILGRIVNPEDLRMSAAERKFMQTYNEKPLLSRPQHEFYMGNKQEELPEQVLCCVRLNGIDYMNYQQLGLTEDPLSVMINDGNKRVMMGMDGIVLIVARPCSRNGRCTVTRIQICTYLRLLK